MINDYDTEILFAKVHRINELYDTDQNPRKMAEEAELQIDLSNNLQSNYGVSEYASIIPDLEDKNWESAYETIHNLTTE